MEKNLNSKLFKRFGIETDLLKVQKGFCSHLQSLLLEDLEPIVAPGAFKDSHELYKIGRAILKEACRQMFLDYKHFTDWDFGCKFFIERNFGTIGNSFKEYLVNLQILLNIVWNYKEIRYEVEKLAQHTSEYFEDFPILGMRLKTYNTKAPQIIPSLCKLFDKEIENILGLLEPEKYKHVLEQLEEGLKEFLVAKTKGDLKDVIEDMYATCDELIKVVSGDKNKGFKHIFTKDEYEKIGFTSKSTKEIYRNLKDWMDNIKHGTLKNYTREDVELIIILSGSFVRYVVNKTS